MYPSWSKYTCWIKKSGTDPNTKLWWLVVFRWTLHMRGKHIKSFSCSLPTQICTCRVSTHTRTCSCKFRTHFCVNTHTYARVSTHINTSLYEHTHTRTCSCNRHTHIPMEHTRTWSRNTHTHGHGTHTYIHTRTCYMHKYKQTQAIISHINTLIHAFAGTENESKA